MSTTPFSAINQTFDLSTPGSGSAKPGREEASGLIVEEPDQKLRYEVEASYRVVGDEIEDCTVKDVTDAGVYVFGRFRPFVKSELDSEMAREIEIHLADELAAACVEHWLAAKYERNDE